MEKQHRLSVAHLRLISPKYVWGSVWERENTFRHLKDFGVDVDYFYEDNIVSPESVSGYDILNIGEFSFGDWQQPFIRGHEHPVIMFQETSLQSLLAGSRNVDLALIKSQHFIALTNWSRDLLIHFGVNGNRITVIPCAADLDTFKPGKAGTETETGIELEKPVFLYVGSFNKRKGAHHAIECFKKAGKGTLLMIEGEFNNDESELVREMIDSLDLGGSVVIKPFTSIRDMPRYYHMSDVVVYPQSYEEGEPVQFGHPLLWGLSCGLPLISLNMGGARDMIMDGTNGYLCNTYDDMVKSMKRLAAYPELRNQFGRESYNLAISRFHPRTVGKQYENAYRKISGG